MAAIGLIGFDGDDTLWRSEEYYRSAETRFREIMAAYLDLDDAGMLAHLLAVERRNLRVFGYGAKGMMLSMIEAAIELTGGAIAAADIQRIIGIGRDTLAHPVELLPGIREAVVRIAGQFPVVLITKGDLFHQEAKIEQSGLADLFPRIEVVSEKDPATYRKVLAEFDIDAGRFVMIGNSLRSDAEPVLALGGWAIHMPYHVTWAHEAEHSVASDHPRLRVVDTTAQLPAAVAAIAAA